MKGFVYSVNIGEKKGEIKKPVEKIELIENYGIKGDCHAERGINRQVSLLSWERMNEEFFCLKRKDDLKPGLFAENITTEKIDLRKLKIGDKLKINEVIIEISEIGKKCHNWCEIGKKVGKCLMPKEGIFGKVIKAGEIKKGDVIEVIPRVFTGILTISDGCFEGKREDKSGEYLKEICKKYGWEVLIYDIVPDEKEVIKSKLREFSEICDLILTTGGTGITKRDISPEATKEIIEKEIPGVSEILRIKTYEKSKYSIISRGICGIKGQTIIINLPGSLNGVKEYFEILKEFLIHLIEMVREFPHE
ncbi:MAG: molybdopterin-binding protein [bacterium]|nr:molybdopterin-binding protein [bacterium]MDW8163601.1 molybdopterin-binding protein [Candidatus Omnitrophota bacterium]